MRRAIPPTMPLALALLALGCSSSSTNVPAGDGAVDRTDATVKPKDDSGGTPTADAATVKAEAHRYTGQLSEWQTTAPVPAESNGVASGFSAGDYLFVVDTSNVTANKFVLYRTKPNADGTLPPWTPIDLSTPTCDADEGSRSGLIFSRSTGYLLEICSGGNAALGDALFGHSTFYTAKFQSDGTFGPWKKAGTLNPGTTQDVLFVGKFLLVQPPVGMDTSGLIPPKPFLLSAELLADGTLGPWVTAMDKAPSYFHARYDHGDGDGDAKWATNGADVYRINPRVAGTAQCGGSSKDCPRASRQVYVATMDATGKLGAFSPSVQVPYNGVGGWKLVAHGFLYSFGDWTGDCCGFVGPTFHPEIYYAPLGQYGILKDWRSAPRLPGGALPSGPFVAHGQYMYFPATLSFYAKFLTELDPKNTGEVPVTPPPASGPGSDCKGSNVAWCASYQKCVNLSCPYWCMGGGIMYCFKGPPSADDVRSTCTEPTAHYVCN